MCHPYYIISRVHTIHITCHNRCSPWSLGLRSVPQVSHCKVSLFLSLPIQQPGEGSRCAQLTLREGVTLYLLQCRRAACRIWSSSAQQYLSISLTYVIYVVHPVSCQGDLRSSHSYCGLTPSSTIIRLVAQEVTVAGACAPRMHLHGCGGLCSIWLACFQCFLTSWHFKVVQQFHVYSLPISESSISPRRLTGWWY